MKFIGYLAIVCLISCSIFKHRKDISKEIPPGTIRFNDSLFVDETEVSNQHWIDYENWFKKKKLDCNSVLLDTNVWIDSLGYNKPFKKYYLRHETYRDYPVVGVSYEQAMAYCKWRSDRVNEYINIREGIIEWEHGLSNEELLKLPQYFKYRLPTKQEWELFASQPIVSGKKRAKQYSYSNFKSRYNEDSLIEGATVTAPVNSYTPNAKGLYNIHGNVMEMVNEKGVAKGGSWKIYEEDYRPIIDYSYIKPQNDLGFRCVAEYIGTKKSSID